MAVIRPAEGPATSPVAMSAHKKIGLISFLITSSAFRKVSKKAFSSGKLNISMFCIIFTQLVMRCGSPEYWELLSIAVFPPQPSLRGTYSKLNGNTELLLRAVWEPQPYLLLWRREKTRIPVMVLNTADSNATKLHHLMTCFWVCFFSTALLSTLMQGNGLHCQLQPS